MDPVNANILPHTDETTDFAGEHSKDRTLIQPILLERVVDEIRRNLWGCDLYLCLFMAALYSYRSDRCLRPFPPFYTKNKEKDFEALKKTCADIPPLKTFLNEPSNYSKETAHLLSWLFVEKGHPVLKRIQLASVPHPTEISQRYRPQYAFEVCYHNRVEEMWRNRRGNRQVVLAYHGSAVDNFYSIVKVGLQQHFSLDKVVLFGNGIYLSTEISVSAHYSPFGQTWLKSELGSKHSIVAICEIINDLSKVRCKDSDKALPSNNQSSNGIPEKYFIVTDSDMVRVKYLILYTAKQSFSVEMYFVKGVLAICLAIYILLMIAGGFDNYCLFLKRIKWFN